MKATAEVAADRLVLRGGGVQIDVSLADGTLSLRSADGQAVLHGARAVAHIRGRRLASGGWRMKQGPARFEDAHGPGARALLSTDPEDELRLHLEICVYDAHPFALLRFGVENAGRESRSVVMLGLSAGLHLESAPVAWRVFRHGWQSWSPTLSLSGAQMDVGSRAPVLAPDVVPDARGSFASDEVAALLDPATGRTLVAGFVSAHRQWTQVYVAVSRRSLTARALADGSPLAPGATMWSERLLLDITSDAPAGLERYAAALGREMGARVPATSPSGWCSWYYYFTTVTEDDVLKNLRCLEDHRRELPFECVQIDDGYQANIGDWTATNEKFPHGMAWLAREIREAGFTPGIWLAPFFAGATSELYRRHPDWFVRDEGGAPVIAMRNWDQECYGLDCTHPDAERWLRELFREVAEGWGYDYLKIDFLFGAAIAGRRYDANATRIEAYRRGLRAIRESAGERFVLGCGALMGPSVGLVDGQRIGPDVAPWWRFNRPVDPPGERGRPRPGGEPSAENALRNILTRSWMHGRLWANDPDCLIARSTRTKLTLPEVQSLATAIGMSGGMVLASDDLTSLTPERRDIISLLLPPLGQAAVARDLMTEAMPTRLEIVVERDLASWWLLGLFNWERRRRALVTTLPPGRWHVFELWECRYYGVRDGQLTLPEVASHGAHLLSLRRPIERPQVIGTSFHVSMGGIEVGGERFDSARSVLEVDLQPVARRRGELFVALPEGWRLADSRLGDRSLAGRAMGGGALAFRFELAIPTTLSLRFTAP